MRPDAAACVAHPVQKVGVVNARRMNIRNAEFCPPVGTAFHNRVPLVEILRAFGEGLRNALLVRNGTSSTSVRLLDESA